MKQFIYGKLSIVFAIISIEIFAQTDIYQWSYNIEATGETELFGNPNNINMLYSVDPSENIYFGGIFRDSIILGEYTFFCNNLNRDSYIVKLTNTGFIKWAKHISSSISNTTWGYCDNYENIYLFGEYEGQMIMGVDTFQNNGIPDIDMFFSKLDTAGNYLWTKSYGGVYLDRISCLITDNEGNIVIGGYYSDELDIEDTILISPLGNGKEAFLAKFTSDGNFKWIIDGKGPNTNRILLCTDDNSLNTYIAGYCFEGMTMDTIELNLINVTNFVAKINSEGRILWAFQFGSGHFYSDSHLLSLVHDSEENFYLYGMFHDSIFIGNYKFYANDMYNTYIIKFNSSGEILWANKYGGAGNYGDFAGDMVINENDYIYIAGYFSGEIELGNIVLTATGLMDIFVAQIDENGNVLWSFNSGGMQADSYLYCNSVDVVGKNLYLGGGFMPDAYLNPFYFISEVGFNGYLAKHEITYVGLDQNQDNNNNYKLKIYPNPADNEISIEITLTQNDKPECFIYNNVGKLVMQCSLGSIYPGIYKKIINTSSLSTGIYLIKCVVENQVITKKCVIY
jgi:hypothetical protein